MPVSGDDGTTGGARLPECIDHAGEQYQLSGRSSLLYAADSFYSHDRSEWRGDGAAAGIDSNHREYFERRKLGWFLFDMPANLDPVVLSWHRGHLCGHQHLSESE